MPTRAALLFLLAFSSLASAQPVVAGVPRIGVDSFAVQFIGPVMSRTVTVVFDTALRITAARAEGLLGQRRFGSDVTHEGDRVRGTIDDAAVGDPVDNGATTPPPA